VQLCQLDRLLSVFGGQHHVVFALEPALKELAIYRLVIGNENQRLSFSDQLGIYRERFSRTHKQLAGIELFQVLDAQTPNTRLACLTKIKSF
jgi:hypothetical protein